MDTHESFEAAARTLREQHLTLAFLLGRLSLPLLYVTPDPDGHIPVAQILRQVDAVARELADLPADLDWRPAAEQALGHWEAAAHLLGARQTLMPINRASALRAINACLTSVQIAIGDLRQII